MPEPARLKPITFSATIIKIGVNPLVDVPPRSINILMKQAGKNAGPIPVKGTLNGKAFIQHVVKYQGKWRLYLNGVMRRSAGIDVGDKADVELIFDNKPRIEPINPELEKALSKNKKAHSVYEQRSPSQKKEINRYLNSLKSPEAVERNVKNVVGLLTGRKSAIDVAFMRRLR